MKVQEFINKVEKESLIADEVLKIKKYIPVVEKKKLAMHIISACTYETDGFIEVDRFKMNIYFDMCVLNAYTDLDVSSDFDEMIVEYDALCESELMFLMKDCFIMDCDAAKKILDNELTSLLEQNSLDAQISKLANGVNKIINSLGEKLEDVDFNSLLPEGIDMGQFEQVMKMIK